MSTSPAFLDTNVLLRHLLNDHPDQSARATALIAAIERGEAVVRIADTVVFETVFTLEKTYRTPRVAIREALQPLLALPGMILPHKRSYDAVFDLYVEMPSLSFADCYHVMLARQWCDGMLISFDEKIGRVPGITRRVYP